MIICPVPLHQWNREKGGKEYREVRTRRYTYVKDLDRPWLLFDNQEDPYQLNNLFDIPEYSRIKEELETELSELLQKTKDEFLPGDDYMKLWDCDY